MGMPRAEVEKLVRDALPGARVVATDLTGTEDHWHLRVEWSGFGGMKLFAQHRRLMDVFQPHLEAVAGGPIHAVQFETSVPESDPSSD
ncbi:MAG: BolA family transcriptional regulator [Planctomycetota bacterium]|nr:MAG: BolA family transcriptional regulator [Planctomycetota bacterium]